MDKNSYKVGETEIFYTKNFGKIPVFVKIEVYLDVLGELFYVIVNDETRNSGICRHFKELQFRYKSLKNVNEYEFLNTLLNKSEFKVVSKEVHKPQLVH
jgi:hypothetical protein